MTIRHFLAGILLLTASSTSAQNILILHADSCPPEAELEARGFTAVDLFNLQGGTPTLAQLTPYDAVLVYTNNPPADPVAAGNVLADYVDAGGGVVLATYA